MTDKENKLPPWACFRSEKSSFATGTVRGPLLQALNPSTSQLPQGSKKLYDGADKITYCWVKKIDSMILFTKGLGDGPETWEGN